MKKSDSLRGGKRLVHTPFSDIRKALRQRVVRVADSSEVETVLPHDKASEGSLFVAAMSGVKPLDPCRRAVGPSGQVRHTRRSCPVPETIEVMTQLSHLISGLAPMDESESEEYLSWSASDLSPARFHDLREGRIPVQAHTDLHGLSTEEAEEEVFWFLSECVRKGLRCVLLIHGRGLNSRNQEPILKRRIPGWLRKSGNRHHVLAYASARCFDGGSGALYVLLRRRTASRNRRENKTR